VACLEQKACQNRALEGGCHVGAVFGRGYLVSARTGGSLANQRSVIAKENCMIAHFIESGKALHHQSPSKISAVGGVATQGICGFPLSAR
jgi:hypothetical protein